MSGVLVFYRRADADKGDRQKCDRIPELSGIGRSVKRNYPKENRTYP
jgi:hypothetical protein